MTDAAQLSSDAKSNGNDEYLKVATKLNEATRSPITTKHADAYSSLGITLPADWHKSALSIDTENALFDADDNGKVDMLETLREMKTYNDSWRAVLFGKKTKLQ